MNLEDELLVVYDKWLLDSFPDEFCCKDDYIEASEQKRHFGQFMKEVRELFKEEELPYSHPLYEEDIDRNR